MDTVLIHNGPNLNLLGSREPGLYGKESLADIENELHNLAYDLALQVVFFQSNFEGALIDQIHCAKSQGINFIIINPGAFTHTSVALRDAFLAVAVPFVEVHLSNIYRREQFRQHSYLVDVAVGSINGLGSVVYEYALRFARHWLTNQRE